MANKTRWLFAVAVGLIAALFVGGLVLISLGGRATLGTPSCAELSPSECALWTDSLRQMGRLQLVVGALFLVLGAGLALVLRKQRPV